MLKSGVDDPGPYCTVEVIQDGRVFGYQVPSRGRPIFGFSDPAWSWEPDSLHAVTVTVDDATAWTGRAPAAAEWLVLPVPAAAMGNPARPLAAGRRITLAVGGRSVAFDLAGFRKAADAQRACLTTFTDKL